MLDELDLFGTGDPPEPCAFVPVDSQTQHAVHRIVHFRLGGHLLLDGVVHGFYGNARVEHGGFRELHDPVCFGLGDFPWPDITVQLVHGILPFPVPMLPVHASTSLLVGVIPPTISYVLLPNLPLPYHNFASFQLRLPAHAY